MRRVDIDNSGEFCSELVPDSTGLASCEAVLSVAPNLLSGIEDPHSLSFTVEDLDGNTGMATTSFEVLSDSAVDNDLDGFSEDEGDCDDSDPDVHPEAEELCNELDDDCDALTDEETTCYDDDGDC